MVKNGQRRRQRGKRKEKFERELRAMREERQRLWEVQRDAPLLPLDKPFQRGWTRFFVLRDDALRRNDAAALRQAFEFVQVRQYCRKGDFRKYDWKAGRYVSTEHRLRRQPSPGPVARSGDPE